MYSSEQEGTTPFLNKDPNLVWRVIEYLSTGEKHSFQDIEVRDCKKYFDYFILPKKEECDQKNFTSRIIPFSSVIHRVREVFHTKLKRQSSIRSHAIEPEFDLIRTEESMSNREQQEQVLHSQNGGVEKVVESLTEVDERMEQMLEITERLGILGDDPIDEDELVVVNARGRNIEFPFGIAKKAPVLRAAVLMGLKAKAVPFVDRDPTTVMQAVEYHSGHSGRDKDSPLIKWLVHKCSTRFVTKFLDEFGVKSSKVAAEAERVRAKRMGWRATLAVGDSLDVLDTLNKWLPATVKESLRDSIFIHYHGHRSTWDEWISIDSNRLALGGYK